MITLSTRRNNRKRSLTDSVTTNIIDDFEHKLKAEMRRQSCQGIHSTYSGCTFIQVFFILLLHFYFNSGIR